MRKPATGRLFLLSNLDSERLARRYGIVDRGFSSRSRSCAGSGPSLLLTLTSAHGPLRVRRQPHYRQASRYVPGSADHLLVALLRARCPRRSCRDRP